MEDRVVVDRERLDALERELLARAFLYEAEQTYRQAIEAAFAALRARLQRDAAIA